MDFKKQIEAKSFLVALLLSVQTVISPLHAQERMTTVLELFTSQGCSSCPQADALLNELAEDRSILTLSYHVDYWDYLGWKDELASPENSRRQREYSAGSDGSVYTPQMIVNGRQALVGSDRTAISSALKSSQSDLPVPVNVGVEGNVLRLEIGAPEAAARGRTEILLLSVEPQRQVEIKAGENTGKTILYRNVVRDHRIIGMWKGGQMQLELPLDEVSDASARECVVLVQEVDRAGQPGAILGAARTSL